ncbi:MAG: DUF4838 domain-containing protein [Opitutales bacterium]|nr:DUF4838 domain-containing protein [Opitutales bacterium]
MRWFFSVCALWVLSAVVADARFYVSRLAPDVVREALAEAVPVLRGHYGEELRLRWMPLIGEPSGDAALVVDAELLEREDLVAEIYRWLHGEWGFRHYVPGEYAVLAKESPKPFRDWLEERSQSRRYITRNLHDIGRARYGQAEQNWAAGNRLVEQFTFNHAHFRIIRPEHFDTHPQWFAKDPQGEPMRPPYPNVSGFNDHPDLSEGEVVERIADTVIERFEAQPELKSFSIGANDSFEFGHFPDDYPWFDPDRYFRRYPDYSNHVFHFSNRVAERVGEVFPDKYMGALAYLSWENVPDFPVHPKIIPYLTADRTQWYDSAFYDEDLALVEAWSEAGPEIIGTWDYIFGYGFLIPRSLTGIVADSIPAVYEAGARAYFSQVSPLWAFDGHTTWLAAQLLDDVDADPESLMEEFFDGYYGPASETMRHFFSVAEFLWMYQPGSAVWLRYYLDAHQAYLFGEEHLVLMRELIDRALLTAKQSREETGVSNYVRRVEYTEQAFRLTELFVRYVHLQWALSRGEMGPVKLVRGDTPAFDFSGHDPSSLAGVQAMIAELRELEVAFRSQRESMLESSPLHQRFADSDWALFGDPGPRRLWQMQKGSVDAQLVFVADWVDGRERWRRSLLNTESAQLDITDSGVRAEQVRRGQLFSIVRVEPGQLYAADVRLRGVCGPSANIFVRLDWYDADGQQLERSPWDRLPPGEYKQGFQLGPVAKAPQSASFVRLFIRFYEQEPGDWIEVDDARLYQLSALEGLD